jgi:hypothetical protein
MPSDYTPHPLSCEDNFYDYLVGALCCSFNWIFDGFYCGLAILKSSSYFTPRFLMAAAAGTEK